MGIVRNGYHEKLNNLVDARIESEELKNREDRVHRSSIQALLMLQRDCVNLLSEDPKYALYNDLVLEKIANAANEDELHELVRIIPLQMKYIDILPNGPANKSSNMTSVILDAKTDSDFEALEHITNAWKSNPRDNFKKSLQQITERNLSKTGIMINAEGQYQLMLPYGCDSDDIEELIGAMKNDKSLDRLAGVLEERIPHVLENQYKTQDPIDLTEDETHALIDILSPSLRSGAENSGGGGCAL